MDSRVRDAVAPLYLLLCLIVGGSAQGIWANMLLQLLGVGILAWAAVVRSEPWTRPQIWLGVCIIAGLLVAGLQLVPLPPNVWEHLGGREVFAAGYRVLGIPPPWLPVSLAPYDSAATLLTLIPPLALLAAMWRLGSRPFWLIIALLIGTLAGIVLGALQVSSADPETSRWYFYARTNYGVATGFFANANHMATLLVASLPFLAAVLAAVRARGGNVQRYSATFALVAGAALVIAVGLAINGSLAGYGLVLPVAVASVLVFVRRGSPTARWLVVGAAVLLIAAVGALTFTPIGSGTGLRAGAATSALSRQEIFKTSALAAGDLMPMGAGLGTFREVYAIYEDHERLDPNAVVNHAHNDYLELVLETGLPGLAVLLLFLAWWASASWRAWKSPEADPFARAATIASAAILVHSLVDFPLRTAAISACFAMCLGLLAARPRHPAPDRSSLRPTRHVVVS